VSSAVRQLQGVFIRDKETAIYGVEDNQH